jgi:DNA-binding transcriptional MerR regulator
MKKRKFRIGELAKELKVKKYVVRFWEREFQLHSDRSDGGQRFYTQDDFEKFSYIKDLLYTQGFTIAGTKKQLISEHAAKESARLDVAEVEATQAEVVGVASIDQEHHEDQQKFMEGLKKFKIQLLEIRGTL